MPSKKKRSTKETVEAIKEAALEPDLADGALTPKMENFIAAYFETGNASEAYRRAYNAENCSPETIHVRACELLKHSKVAVRVAELRARAAQRSVLTAQTILDELEQARMLALQLEQPAVMVSASMGRAKVGGLVIDKKEVGGAGAFDNMSADELRRYVAEESEALGISPPAKRSVNGTGTKH